MKNRQDMSSTFLMIFWKYVAAVMSLAFACIFFTFKEIEAPLFYPIVFFLSTFFWLLIQIVGVKNGEAFYLHCFRWKKFDLTKLRVKYGIKLAPLKLYLFIVFYGDAPFPICLRFWYTNYKSDIVLYEKIREMAREAQLTEGIDDFDEVKTETGNSTDF